MSMPVPKPEIYTIQHIYDLPEGQRAELIDGQIYDMAPPGRTHQSLVTKFTYEIKSYIRNKHGDCEVYPAPFAVFLNKDEFTYVEPDLSVICDSSKLDEKGCHGAPDWVIEIVSPGSRRMDYYIKLFKYQSAGVREYWIVDSEKQRAVVYNFEKETTEEYSFEDEIPVGIYEEFSIKIRENLREGGN